MFEIEWQKLWAETGAPHPLYSALGKHYSILYATSSFVDFSFLVREGCNVLAGVQIAISEEKEATAFGHPVLYLESSSASSISKSKLLKMVGEEVQRIISDQGVSRLHYRNRGAELSLLGAWLLENGASCTPYLTQKIDLSLSPENLRKGVRHGFRDSISWGERNLEVSVLSGSVTSEEVEEMRQLHINAAERETRSSETWDTQKLMAQAGEAFFVMGRQNEELVSAVFCQHSSEMAYYSVSASRRDLWENPLTHVLMWRAILEAKSLGCQYFEIGEQKFVGQLPKPTVKEMGVSHFKSGFGGFTQVQLDIEWTLKAGE